MRYTLLFYYLFLSASAFAQFSPQAGQEGSTAIAADDPIFVNWAKNCVIERGYLDIADPEYGTAGTGWPEEGCGPADNQIVSLGDGGIATLGFEPSLRDADGFDFAVFENGFGSPNGDFLELAFVEVSSDGENFVRFPASSLTQDSVQIGTFGTTQAEKTNNLAGKYYAGYGVPFDLAELADFPDIDIQNITHIRVIDVVGSINENYASYDKDGNKINDPYPTAFPTGGFDLDAIGVIHQNIMNNIDVTATTLNNIYPNPAHPGERIHTGIKEKGVTITLSNSAGKQIALFHSSDFMMPELSPGLYFLHIKTNKFQSSKTLAVW